jgi:hypothetical protein
MVLARITKTAQLAMNSCASSFASLSQIVMATRKHTMLSSVFSAADFVRKIAPDAVYARGALFGYPSFLFRTTQIIYPKLK